MEEGEYVLLEVSDTGQGMDVDILERIFEPFYSTKLPGEGTGLGLAMVFGIVKGHNGHISCYSEPGEGTTFKIYFPVLGETEIEDDVYASRQTPAFGTETLLLVDDEELIRELGAKILKGAGYTVFHRIKRIRRPGALPKATGKDRPDIAGHDNAGDGRRGMPTGAYCV